MPLVSKYDFVGELDIPRTGDANVLARLNLFIDEYEPEFLQKLFGTAFYTDFIAGTTVSEGETMETKWSALQAKLPKMIARYVYWFWMKDDAVRNVGLGTVKVKAENATVVSPSGKMHSMWNKNAPDIEKLFDYLDVNRALYPNLSSDQRYIARYFLGFNNPLF